MLRTIEFFSAAWIIVVGALVFLAGTPAGQKALGHRWSRLVVERPIARAARFAGPGGVVVGIMGISVLVLPTLTPLLLVAGIAVAFVLFAGAAISLRQSSNG